MDESKAKCFQGNRETMSKKKDSCVDIIEMTAGEIHDARRDGRVTFEKVARACLVSN